MKKVAIGVIVGMLMGGSLVGFAAQSEIKLIVNGKEIESDVPPQVISGRTMIPARPLAEALGATVEWDGQRRAVVITTTDGTPTDLSPVNTIPTDLPIADDNPKVEDNHQHDSTHDLNDDHGNDGEENEDGDHRGRNRGGRDH
ncbi:copper amine oxidase N-terminal domain-containing protein [Ammoniphilus sp. 3BR4]|uniref:copper amine oxidase N-terminal domain-containing protein n=1 Tax=Ammoniphilus sp. 3BR4 TaxID=3158265 RepID=UPI0034667577